MGGTISNSSTAQRETHWFPEDILNASNDHSSYGVIILNRPIQVPSSVLTKLWTNAKIRVTVDKGTDRWLTFLQTHQLDPAQYKPDLVTGDFDSVSQGGIAKFKQMGSLVVPTPDQSATDFQKAVREIRARAEVHYIIAVVESNGRLDHLMSNINTLYKSQLPIYLLSGKYMSWMLRADGGQHRIHLPLQFTHGKKNVGLIPVGHPVHGAYSTGLRWNLNNHTLQFGGLISSSNTYQSHNVGEVTVKIGSGGDLFWIMQLPKRTDYIGSDSDSS